MEAKEDMSVEREQIRQRYARLFDTTAEILFRHDPIGINLGDNSDEYEPEVTTILPRLESAASEADALQIIHEEFIEWFDDQIAGPKDKYEACTSEIWAAWRQFKASS